MTDLETLTPTECWDRLRSTTVGRIGFDRGRGARIHPVDYAVVSQEIYLRTSRDSELGMFTELFADGALVPFEVDQLDEAGDEGWSVLVRGRLEAQDGAGAAGPVGEGAAQPPAGHSELVLRLTPVQVTGRRRSAG
jgi:nitroimidazol reductase NimA-like FMN-containing flavoprotein (pyridoxamine 5'-phosphate oxidase superfamily)